MFRKMCTWLVYKYMVQAHVGLNGFIGELSYADRLPGSMSHSKAEVTNYILRVGRPDAVRTHFKNTLMCEAHWTYRGQVFVDAESYLIDSWSWFRFFSVHFVSTCEGHLSSTQLKINQGSLCHNWLKILSGHCNHPPRELFVVTEVMLSTIWWPCMTRKNNQQNVDSSFRPFVTQHHFWNNLCSHGSTPDWKCCSMCDNAGTHQGTFHHRSYTIRSQWSTEGGIWTNCLQQQQVRQTPVMLPLFWLVAVCSLESIRLQQPIPMKQGCDVIDFTHSDLNHFNTEKCLVDICGHYTFYLWNKWTY